MQIGNGKPPISVTPRSKPISFIAIWPWSWYIVTTASKLPLARAHEHRVGRERALDVDACASRRFDGGRDDVDFLAAEVAAVAGVRIEPGDRDARRCEVRRRACDRSVSRIASTIAPTVSSDATADSGTCDVTRAFHSFVEDVEFARRSARAEHFRRKPDLVVVARMRAAHRRLVERREADGIGAARGAELQRGAEVRERELAAGARRLADLDARGIEVREVDEHGFRTDWSVVAAVAQLDIGTRTRRAGTGGKHARIADDDDIGGGAHLGKCYDLGGQLGADACGVAHGKRDDGTRSDGAMRSLQAAGHFRGPGIARMLNAACRITDRTLTASRQCVKSNADYRQRPR